VTRPLRLGMVGGGEGAQIGPIHRLAASLDGRFVLVAGCFDVDPERSVRFGREVLGLDPARCYPDVARMVEGERARDDRIELVAVVTPNHTHAPIARTFLEAGIPVLCEKPLATEPAAAQELVELARATRCLLAVAYCYWGFSLVQEMRARIRRGDLGTLRVVRAVCPIQWLAAPVERAGRRAAAWRVDPGRAGAGVVADVGTHAFHLARYVTGLRPRRLAADLVPLVEGRAIDDDAGVWVEFEGGARGRFWFSQVAIGRSQGLALEVFGSEGALGWSLEDASRLRWTPLGGSTHLVEVGRPDLSPEARAFGRVPQGHPEGYLDAFANLYRGAAARLAGEDDLVGALLPTGEDGLEGVRFVARALAASARGGWVDWLEEAA